MNLNARPAVRFGILTMPQQMTLAAARNGGTISTGEMTAMNLVDSYSQHDAFSASSAKELTAADSETLVHDIGRTVKWNLRRAMSPTDKEPFRRKLDTIRDVLIQAPFTVSDAVIGALENSYRRVS